MLNRLINDILNKHIKSFPSVALLGARQIGKTTLAKHLAKSIDSIYLDLENPQDLLKLDDARSFLMSQNHKLIILDEIQRIPELFMVLRGVIDENRENGKKSGQFLFLGSASMDLINQSSESLAGRISYIDMYGLNLLEINQPRQQIKKLWYRGGFPESYLKDSDNEAMVWLENLIRTYLERDIPQMGFKIPAQRLRKLWTMLAHLQGETINYSSLASNLEVDAKTISNYIDILTQLLLVRKLKPWHFNTKKRLVKSARHYVCDSGILHRLLGINNHNELISNPVLSKSWEGFVIENIYSVLPMLAETYFYRTSAGAEIDLIIRFSASEIWAIEIKYGSAPKINKNFSTTCDDVGATHKYIVYGGNEEFSIKGDITMIPLETIMKKIISKTTES